MAASLLEGDARPLRWPRAEEPNAFTTVATCGGAALRHLVDDVGRWADMAVYAILREEWAASSPYAPYRVPFTRPWTDSV